MNRIWFVILAILLVSSVGCFNITIPGGTIPGTGSSANQPPVAYIDSINPKTATSGDSVAFNGHGTDVDGTVIGYEWRSSLSGIISTAPSFTTTSLSAGTHVISLRVLDNSNLWSAEVNATVIINPRVAVPVIELFVTDPGTINKGNATVLRWTVSGAQTVFIDNGIGQVAGNGTRTLYPTISTTYNLSASNTGGTVTASASVIVQDILFTGNPVISFTAQHLGGTSWQLNWNVSNSTEQVIEPEVGPVNATGSTVITVPSGQLKTYRLTATNSNTGGWAYWQVILQSP